MSKQHQSILDIESIKCLKARYLRAMDTKNWDTLSRCFTEDLVADFREAPGMLAEGRDNYMRQLVEALKEAITVHHGHMPEIEIVDENQASGVWAMEDFVQLPDLLLQGWGHYHETYRKEEGVWKIAQIKLTRLRLLYNGEEQAL
jgi:hypothetical protein